MTTNTAAKTETASKNTVAWPQRFGTIKSVQVKTGRKGRYAIMTVDCSKFEQVAFAFGDKIVDQIVAAGSGARVWFKGPLEAVEKTNAAGGTYTEDQMKVVYFKNKSAEAGAAAEEGAETDTTTAEQAADETAGATTESSAAAVEEEDEIPF